jgi:hypothetical protein
MKTKARLVYQGGHHDVFCNGVVHLTFRGDSFGTSPISPLDGWFDAEMRMCDCAKFQAKPSRLTT